MTIYRAHKPHTLTEFHWILVHFRDAEWCNLNLICHFGIFLLVWVRIATYIFNMRYVFTFCTRIFEQVHTCISICGRTLCRSFCWYCCRHHHRSSSIGIVAFHRQFQFVKRAHNRHHKLQTFCSLWWQFHFFCFFAAFSSFFFISTFRSNISLALMFGFTFTSLISARIYSWCIYFYPRYCHLLFVYLLCVRTLYLFSHFFFCVAVDNANTQGCAQWAGKYDQQQKW